MKKTKTALRKLLIGLIGFPLLALGIVLVPLPGPGVLVSLLAFFILSFAFEWADTGLQEAKRAIHKIYLSAREQAAKIDPDLK